MKNKIINRNVLILLITVIVTVMLWQFQTGRYIIYPFTILGTWFHEMGHGLTAIILGGSFNYLELFPDGSGLAVHTGNLLFGSIGRAVVAAGGPVFPIIIGSVLIIASVKFKSSNIILFAFGLLMFVSVALWVRTLFGIASISLIGAVLLIISLRANKNVSSFILQLLGIEACVSFKRRYNRRNIISFRHTGDSKQPSPALLVLGWNDCCVIYFRNILQFENNR